jgi:O-antigen/teichoic acid export membrane protein
VSIVAIAPLAAQFYGDELLVPYFHLVAIAIIVELVPLQIVTMLRREMTFGKIAIINITGSIVTMVTTVGLALAGFSYMSFAWSWLATSAATAALALFYRPHFWMFVPSFSNWKVILKFGVYNGATVSLFRIYEAVPYLILGRVVSPEAAALYNRSLVICQLPNKVFLGGLVSVALPAFSATAREGRSLKQPYLNALSLVTGLQWPALLGLCLLAHPIVGLLFGQQWMGAVPVVQIVSLSLLFSFSFDLNYPVLVSLGAIRDVFFRAVIVAPVAAAVVASAALLGGIHAVALSMLIVVPFHALVSLSFVCRRLELSWSEIPSALAKSAAVALTSSVGPIVTVISAGGFDISLFQAMAAGVFSAIGWGLGLVVTKHPLRDEIVRMWPWIRKAMPWMPSTAFSGKQL